MFAVPLILLAPISAVLLAAVITPVYWWAYSPPHPEARSVRGKRGIAVVKRTMPFLVVLAVYLLVLESDRIWLPPEIIELRGGGTEYGYVLREQDGEMRVLRDADRSVVVFDMSEVVGRQICARGSANWWNRPLFALGRDHPDYPPCP